LPCAICPGFVRDWICTLLIPDKRHEPSACQSHPGSDCLIGPPVDLTKSQIWAVLKRWRSQNMEYTTIVLYAMKTPICLTVLCFGLAASAAAQENYRLMLERQDTTEAPPDQSYVWSYGSFGNLVQHNGSFDPMAIDVAPEFKTVGLEYDGKYRLLLQARDTNANPPNETFVWSYNTYEDLINHNSLGFESLAGNLDSEYQIAELMYDGKYRLLLQNRSTAGGPPSESYLWSFDTYSDMISFNGTFVSMGVNIADEYSTVGLTYDGKYRMILQNRDTGTNPPTESYIWTYDTFDDFVNHANGTFESMDINLQSTFRTAGLAYEPVPEPATMAALGLGVAALLRRRRK